MPYEYKGVKIYWLGHDSFRISDGATLYVDPYNIAGGPLADIILISHDHFDHLSLDDIRKVVKDDTVIVAAQHCGQQLKGFKNIELVVAGSRVSVKGVEIEAVPAYNVNKFKEPGVVFHTKAYGGVGFIINIGGVRIYHAGDTDLIDEMKNFRVDVALLPVSGTYVMTAEEAAKAANIIKPSVAIPMHYGAIVGSVADAQEFKRRCNCEVVILSKER